MTRIEVYLSGVHSDPDPSPGIGTARSLREAFPNAILHAVDYSVRSSGLHHPVFDGVLVQPVWSELDVPTYSSQIHRHLDQRGSCWLSGLDVETDWLAGAIPGHPRLLVPTATAQQVVRKPVLACASSLRMRVPEFLPASSAPTDLHALGRRSGWHLWVKGRYHGASAAYGFSELRRQVGVLESHWPLEDIFVQRHVPGLERSITFAAYNGRLLDAVEVEKRIVTSQGKTWAAAVTEAPADVVARLASFLADVCWTGGGEVEFIRDGTGVDWLIDFNPRFPAYIFGVTLCGHNLPACLVAAALGEQVSSSQHAARQFIRVVQELPVREDLPLPRLVPNMQGVVAAGKHPSHQPALVKLLARPQLGPKPPGRDPDEIPTIATKLHASQQTPYRLRDTSAVEASLTRLARALESCAASPRMLPALSIKTDPQPQLAKAFLDRCWWAEVISLAELEWAQAIGFAESQIVFNGPAVLRLVSTPRQRVGMAFADSIESFESLARTQQSDVLGFRLRPSGITSRFGIDLTDYSTFERAVACLRAQRDRPRLGLHFHTAADTCGPTRWRDILEQALNWANALSHAASVAFGVLDIGGGWHSEDFIESFLPRLPDVQNRIARVLPNITTIVFEPGKAVASETAWLVTTIIEVRSRHGDGVIDVVVDASIADLPMAPLYGHRMLHLRDGQCLGWLAGGVQRVLVRQRFFRSRFSPGGSDDQWELGQFGGMAWMPIRFDRCSRSWLRCWGGSGAVSRGSRRTGTWRPTAWG